ncbi:unnamed protein product [Sphenostylis stenocarpa]|uniref:Uncharacterized protein n=1 Tax=Sphenostylis stenocarpa TaxID=92480 RepID=A0AA86T646_9FABA|nr:unnamed protein product [Sphenostylis stenocarpa]
MWLDECNDGVRVEKEMKCVRGKEKLNLVGLNHERGEEEKCEILGECKIVQVNSVDDVGGSYDVVRYARQRTTIKGMKGRCFDGDIVRGVIP